MDSGNYNDIVWLTAQAILNNGYKRNKLEMQKQKTDDRVHWRCSVRNKSTTCPATVHQDGDFEVSWLSNYCGTRVSRVKLSSSALQIQNINHRHISELNTQFYFIKCNKHQNLKNNIFLSCRLTRTSYNMTSQQQPTVSAFDKEPVST